MRDRAAFFRRVAASDGYGNEQSGFAAEPFLSCWADVLDKLGNERLEAGRLEASRVATLRVRSAAETLAVQMDDMVQVRGQSWNIRSVAAVGRANEMIEFLLETGVAQ
jgi:SPP1 family predicted phage head-tail adaptor